MQAPRYTYTPATGAQAIVAVAFYKDAAAFVARLRPAGYKLYKATAAETTASFTAAAIAESSGLQVGVTWLLTQSDFVGAARTP